MLPQDLFLLGSVGAMMVTFTLRTCVILLDLDACHVDVPVHAQTWLRTNYARLNV